ncbi:hypothetical protein BGZ63DRAFT_409560 [Mariannaea sp. PMI_226]|nr:hypothetical protein BGZ63DRAFT_409560 [Mariannaea sp. PMI_226]
MHYSEQMPSAISLRERQNRCARVKTLPPCACDMDLMIEAKDKEQAIFELMHTYKLPGWDKFNNMIPHERDDNLRKANWRRSAKKGKEKITEVNGEECEDRIEISEETVDQEDFAMGGPQNRVYWPEGLEEWLRPEKTETQQAKENEVCMYKLG